MREAIEWMADGLSLRLERAARNWTAIRGGPASSPARRMAAPELARARVCAGPAAAEAAAGLELLDYDLFTEKATGEDSVIYQTPDGYRLAQVRPRPHPPVPWTRRSRSASIQRRGSQAGGEPSCRRSLLAKRAPPSSRGHTIRKVLLAYQAPNSPRRQ
jgi:hypothetical protein